MGLTQMQVLVIYTVAIIYIVGLPLVTSDDVILQKRSERNRIDMDRFLEDDPRRKRPFCNAFTGCGKKRSDESMATLVELNSEPAVEELSKQILSEAKLWEAIQEARAELHRPQHNPRDRPMSLTMTGLRRKRASTDKTKDLLQERNEEQKAFEASVCTITSALFNRVTGSSPPLPDVSLQLAASVRERNTSGTV